MVIMYNLVLGVTYICAQGVLHTHRIRVDEKYTEDLSKTCVLDEWSGCHVYRGLRQRRRGARLRPRRRADMTRLGQTVVISQRGRRA